MLNLNDAKYENDKLDVTAENILNYIPEYNIFHAYIDNLLIGKTFKSPLREEEKNPSFGVYWSKRHEGRLMFKDLSTGSFGDCFTFVMELYNLSYNNALLKVIFDFRINHFFKIKDDVKITPQKKIPILLDRDYLPKHNEVVIQVTTRDWQLHDVKFWQGFGIGYETLKKYRVYPITHIFVNEKIIVADKHAYVYHEHKDGIDRYKVYQPYSKTLKWLSNFVEGTISGWDQMPESGESLIITSSLKDVMILSELGYAAISPQTETYTFKPHIVDILYKRFKKIYIFYDYDKAGISNAYKNKKLFGFIPIFTKSTNLKDPSDYGKVKGRERLHTIIKTQIISCSIHTKE